MRAEPVVFLSFVERNLQSAYTDSEQAKPNVVKPRHAGFQTRQVRRIVDKLRNEQQGQNSHGDVDIENPAPGIVVCNPAAQRGTNGWSTDNGDSIQCEGQSAFFRRKGVGEDCLRHRLQSAAECTLQHAEKKQHTKARRDTAEKRTECKSRDAHQKETLT